MKKETAFSPGHISGFFQPVYHENIYQTGSRGAGINLNLGVTAVAHIENDREQHIDIYIKKKNSRFPVVTQAIKELIHEETYHIIIELTLDLPFSQGFGMSASSCLSATYAVASLLQIPFQEAIKASHKSEIQMKTGLGDVVAEVYGGVEIRKIPGLPPWGQLISINESADIVVCTIDKELSTPSVLSDVHIQSLVQSFGKECTDNLLKNPTLEQLFYQSKLFTKQTHLASKKVQRAMEAVKQYGQCSMCMLGNSVFATGKTEKIGDILSKFGTVQFCTIDQKGVRIISN